MKGVCWQIQGIFAGQEQRLVESGGVETASCGEWNEVVSGGG